MPLGMSYPAGRDGSISTGPPLGGYTTFGGDPETAQPAKRSGLGKYPWLFGDLPTSQIGPQTNDFGFALGQKARRAPMGVTVVGKSIGPGKEQQGGFFGQPFKGGIF